MTWYIFPSKKEDRLILLIVLSTALLFKAGYYPFLENPYWILFFEIGGYIITIYLWGFSLIMFKTYYSDKIRELEEEAKRIKKS